MAKKVRLTITFPQHSCVKIEECLVEDFEDKDENPIYDLVSADDFISMVLESNLWTRRWEKVE